METLKELEARTKVIWDGIFYHWRAAGELNPLCWTILSEKELIPLKEASDKILCNGCREAVIRMEKGFK